VKEWAPSIIGLAALLLSVMQSHHGGSSKLIDQLQKNNQELATASATLKTVCDRLEKKDETDRKQDDRLTQVETTQARMLQRLGMNP
jgi:predicted transcriptional regulator